MPRYHFHIDDGTLIADEEGKHLPDLAEAHREAMRRASAMLIQGSDHYWQGGMWSVSVTDEKDHVLFKLNFSAIVGLA